MPKKSTPPPLSGEEQPVLSPPRKQPHLSTTEHSRNTVQLLHPAHSPACQLYLSPHWSSTYGTTLLAAGRSSSLSWLAPGSRRSSHCRAGSHHPHASLSACSFQPEISHIVTCTAPSHSFSTDRRSSSALGGSTDPPGTCSWAQTCLWQSNGGRTPRCSLPLTALSSSS